jgi:hypothetical protein
VDECRLSEGTTKHEHGNLRPLQLEDCVYVKERGITNDVTIVDGLGLARLERVNKDEETSEQLGLEESEDILDKLEDRADEIWTAVGFEEGDQE